MTTNATRRLKGCLTAVCIVLALLTADIIACAIYLWLGYES